MGAVGDASGLELEDDTDSVRRQSELRCRTWGRPLDRCCSTDYAQSARIDSQRRSNERWGDSGCERTSNRTTE